ncbi:hypothetical protein KFE25_011796 [Diacronema lutheri]|uniref:Uncharacterized protein n=1 Tax=Diacronema lutheri TaxID=2081491 RepID=A0A8J5XBM7_DIALT|nr:hypothetical protein KFE25_011796 [Diacronema lutheri]
MAGLGLPLRPARGQQVECNAPLTASAVRVDKSVAPAFEHFDVHAVSAHEAARREQLRAFQAELLARISRLEQAKREEQRARAARLATVHDTEKGRARALAAHASAELAKALRLTPARARAARARDAPSEAGAEAAMAEAARPPTKLRAQAQQVLSAVLAARASLRASTLAARAAAAADVRSRGDDDGADSHGDDADGATANEGAAAAARESSDCSDGHFCLPVDSTTAASQRGSSRARARERLGALAAFDSPPAQPPTAAGRGAQPSPRGGGAVGGAGGRSREALRVFDSVRKEQLSAEREYVRQLSAETARRAAARERSAALKRARAEQVEAEAKAAAAREHVATAAEMACAQSRADKVQKAAARARARTQAARYSEALRASLKAKLETHEGRLLTAKLPPLCACGLHPLDDHVALCAHNCELRANPHGYALALSRLLVANGAGHLLDVHSTLLPHAKPRAKQPPAAERAQSPQRTQSAASR